MRAAGYVLLLILMMKDGAWAAGAETDLYRCRTLVTGIRDETRIPAVPGCLLDVLAKVSGDARLLHDPRAEKLAAGGTLLVTEYSFRDRLAGRQIHDEQGTRDRPYILTITFDPQRVDDALVSLGSKPWTGDRPRLAVFLVVDNAANVYTLANDGAFGRDQRESLNSASWQTGMPIILPSEADLAAEGLTVEALTESVEPIMLEPIAERMGADAALRGRLVWNKSKLGWAASWYLIDSKETNYWKIEGVNFDDAFRNALRGSAQLLSGSGGPNEPSP